MCVWCSSLGFAAWASAAPPTTPTLTVGGAPSSVLVGDNVSLTAQLADGNDATGTIAIEVFGPFGPGDVAACNGTPAGGASVDEVNGDNLYAASPPFVPQTTGEYRLAAEYTPAQDDNANTAASTGCSATVKVNPRSPTLTTTVTPATVQPGEPITVTTTVTGAFKPAEPVRFSLFGPNDDQCSGNSTGATGTINEGNGKATATFQKNEPGEYRVVASFAGDRNNYPAGETCSAAKRVTVQSVQAPREEPISFLVAATTLSGKPLTALPRKGRFKVAISATNPNETALTRTIEVGLGGVKLLAKGQDKRVTPTGGGTGAKVVLSLPKGPTKIALIVMSGRRAAVEIKSLGDKVPVALKLARETGAIVLRRDGRGPLTPSKRLLKFTGTISKAVCTKGEKLTMQARASGGTRWIKSVERASVEGQSATSPGRCSFSWELKLPKRTVLGFPGIVYRIIEGGRTSNSLVVRFSKR